MRAIGGIGTYWTSYDTCSPCAPGSYIAVNGSTVCALCDPGMYQAQSGQTHCVACIAGTYNPNQGGNNQLACVACGVGTYSLGTTTAREWLCGGG